MDQQHFWRPSRLLLILFVAILLSVQTGFGQTTSDVTITYSYDEDGNRLLESIKTGSVTDTTLTVTTSTPADTETGNTTPSAITLQSTIGITPSGGTPPYVYLWTVLTAQDCANDTADFTLVKGYWTANQGINTVFQTSCGQGATCNDCTKWQLTVTDSLGTKASSQPTVRITHTYAPS